jgi:hypothetical protein
MGKAADLIAARGGDERYGLDEGRAENLRRLLGREDLLADWAPTILSALETEALKKLRTSLPNGLDPALVTDELSRR